MNGMTTKTTFRSDRHLNIFQDNPLGGLERYTKIWYNFIHGGEVPLGHRGYRPAETRIKEYNGRVVNDVIVFDSEQDKTWFILRWS